MESVFKVKIQRYSWYLSFSPRNRGSVPAIGFQSPQWGDNSKVREHGSNAKEIQKFPSPRWGVILKEILCVRERPLQRFSPPQWGVILKKKGSG